MMTPLRKDTGTFWMTLWPTGACAVLALLISGCHQDSDWLLSYQLERSFGLADVFTNKTHLDIGTDADRTSLLEGWSWNETNTAGETFVWSNGASSSLGFFIYDIRDSVLALRGLAFETEDSPQQTVSIGVAGTSLGEFSVAPHFTDISVPVPASTLTVGWNTFDLHYAWIRSDLPSQQGAQWRRKQRDLAVAWDSAALFASGAETSPDADSGQLDPAASASLIERTLTIQGGASVEYELELSPGSRLTIDDIHCQDCNPGALAIEVFLGQLDAPGLLRIGTIDQESRTLALTTLSYAPLHTHALILRALGQGHLVLKRPSVERPRPN